MPCLCGLDRKTPGGDPGTRPGSKVPQSLLKMIVGEGERVGIPYQRTQKQDLSYLLGEVAIRLNGHLPDQLWLPAHHYGRVPLVIHLRLNIILKYSCF